MVPFFNYLTLFFNFAQIKLLELIKGKAMQRVSNLEKEDYTTSEKEIFDAAEQFLGRTSNLMKILITHTPEIARWWLGFLVSIRQDGLGSSSDVKLRGLACVKLP